MIAKIRELDAGTAQVHGLGVRPSKADRSPLDVVAIERYNAGVERAVRANRDRIPDEAPRNVVCSCGGRFNSERGLATHRAQHCPERAA